MKTFIISLFVVALSLPTWAQEVDLRSYSELHYAVKLTKHYRFAGPECAATKIGPKQYLTHAFCTAFFLTGGSSANIQVLVPGEDPIISISVTSRLHVGVFDMINRTVDYIDTDIESIRYTKSTFRWMIDTMVAAEKGEDLAGAEPNPTPINAAIITVKESTFIPAIQINELPKLRFLEKLESIEDLKDAQKVIVSSNERSSPYNPSEPRAAMASVVLQDGEYGLAALADELIMGRDARGFGGAVWAINKETQELQFAGLTASPGSHPSIVQWSLLNEQMMQLIHLK